MLGDAVRIIRPWNRCPHPCDEAQAPPKRDGEADVLSRGRVVDPALTISGCSSLSFSSFSLRLHRFGEGDRWWIGAILKNDITAAAAIVTDAELDPDSTLVQLWLHGRSATTQLNYRLEAERFRRFIGKPLAQVALIELQAFADSLEAAGLQAATRRRALAAVKSLYTFSHRLGALPYDTARALRLPAVRDSLSDRILEEGQVHRLIAVAKSERDSIMLTLLYATGVRVSELSSMRWQHVSQQNGKTFISIFGKGAKTRVVICPASVSRRLLALRNCAADDAPLFMSRRKRAISPSQVLHIVKQAAKRAQIERNVVVHSFRHAHASHALDRLCPLSVLQSSMGHSSLQSTSKYIHARPGDSPSNYLPL